MMRALTLQQPYASAIAIGPKRVENRSKPIVHARALAEADGWLALHAGVGWYSGFDPRLANVRSPMAREEHARRLANMRVLWTTMPSLDAMPRGVLLGVMRIDRVVADFDAMRRFADHGSQVPVRAAEIVRDPWAFGPVCYGIAEVRLLDKPIAAKGMLGCWRVDPAHEGQLHALVTR